MSMNKWVGIGNLTKDPEYTTASNGTNICKFTVAISRKFKPEEADFINVVTFKGMADNCSKYLKKGSKVCVVGALQIRNYDANDGTKRYVTEIIADEVEFLTSKPASEKPEPAKPEPVATQETMQKFEPIDDDNLPF